MTPEELQSQIDILAKQLGDLKKDYEFFILHTHNGADSTKVYFKELDSTQNLLEVVEGKRIRFKGLNAEYEMYRVAGDTGALRIDAGSAGVGTINIGDSIRPISVYIYGTDEGLIGANNGTNNSYLLVEPTRAGFFTNSSNTFRLRLPNLSADPTAGAVGDLCVVSGVLKICTSASPVTYTIVGTQT